MKRIAWIVLILALLCSFALGEMNENTAQPGATPEATGEVFSCETLIITLPIGYAILDESEAAGYTAAVEDGYDTDAHFLFAASNDLGGAIMIAAIEDETTALDACRSAAEMMLGSAENACESAYGENSYVSFACAIDGNIYQIYYISDGVHLVTVCTVNLSADEICALLESMDF